MIAKLFPWLGPVEGSIAGALSLAEQHRAIAAAVLAGVVSYLFLAFQFGAPLGALIPAAAFAVAIGIEENARRKAQGATPTPPTPVVPDPAPVNQDTPAS